MHIFLTGATGFIGRNLLKGLLEEGHKVTVLLRNKLKVQEFEKQGLQIQIGDLENFKSEYLKGIDAVFHLGAIRKEWGFLPSEYRKVNIEGTKKILEASKENKVRHFIHCSTVFVFGYPEKMPIDENFPFAPTSLYAKSKVEAERLVGFYHKRHCLPTTILRPTMIYGQDDFEGMLLKLCRLIWKRRFLVVGNGKNFIHLTHINDLVQGFLKALQRGGEGEDYIISSKEPMKLDKLCQSIAKIYGKSIIPIKIPISLANLAGGVFEKIYNRGRKMGLAVFHGEPLITRNKVEIISGNQWVSAEKAKKELGFDPQHGNKEIFKIASTFKENGHL